MEFSGGGQPEYRTTYAAFRHAIRSPSGRLTSRSTCHRDAHRHSSEARGTACLAAPRKCNARTVDGLRQMIIRRADDDGTAIAAEK